MTQAVQPEPATSEPHFKPVCTPAIRRFSHLQALPRLLLVVAPRGYGKSVFLSAIARALRAAGCNSEVHTLDEGRSDFATALTHIERLLGCGTEGAGMMFYGVPMIEIDARIDAILQAAEQLQEDTVLLIDGFDANRDGELGNLIERLVLSRQTRLRIVVSSVELPIDSFHRIRLEDGLRELGAADLSLGSEEIRSLFDSSSNPVPLSPEQAEIIHTQTEGWPAAVRLMHVAMSSRVNPASICFGTTALDTNLTNILSRRVLGAINPAIAEFLLDIADLEAFNADLCSFATAKPQAPDMLAELIRLNLMIFPAADRPGWFRFHGLFSDYLRRESRATRSEAERHAVLGRAVQWCRKHGEYRDAFELALTIHDGTQASDILAGRAQGVVRDEGRHLFYINAYERLLEIEPFPADEAQYWYVWAMLFARQYEKAYRVLAAMRLGTKSDDPVADRMPGRKQALLSIILFSLDRIPEARARGERWLESDDGLDPFESSGVACVVGTSAVADLDFPAARRAIMLARNSMSRTGSEYGLGWMSCLDALIDIEEGDLAFVHDTLQEAVTRARKLLGPAASIVSTMDMMAARIALERGDLDEARERLLNGLSQAKEHGFIETTKVGLEVAVRLWDGSQDSVFAPRHLDPVATSFPPRLQLLLQCAVLVRLVRLGLIEAATDWVRRQDMEGLLSARPPSLSATQLASARRSLLAARIAWLIAQRDFQAALAATDIELHSALKSPCATWQVHLLLTRLEIEAATGHAAQASKTLLRAIGIAAPRRLLQPFVEHADVIQPLIMADPKKNWPLVNDKEFVFFADLRQRLGPALAPDRSSPQQEAAADSFELDAPTSREIELLGFLDSGLSNQEIADRLGLTVGTVKWHLHNLFMKLRVRNRSAAIFKAKRAGLLNR
ncbi:LuxR C-terminal-related transcriptional regulator [Aromatoleum toluclasticum]|uniref:LuxR C-terminal-related transcriptional regulator n=1 Tax=Aromatoleum toluclasticum TaxID=92003 RepID=UPI0012F9BECE|nr:LuxR C-terminal-related transcriptional regulator [Aromatoleum toluclasticum]